MTMKTHGVDYCHQQALEEDYLREMWALLDEVQRRGTPWSEEDAARYRDLLRRHEILTHRLQQDFKEEKP